MQAKMLSLVAAQSNQYTCHQKHGQRALYSVKVIMMMILMMILMMIWMMMMMMMM